MLLKGLRHRAYLHRIPERFGFFKSPEITGGLWLHAVSVGETIAAVPFIKRIQQQYPKLPITVTTMTPTGSERVSALLKDSVFHVYVPYDLPFVVHRFLNKIKPSVVMIMETEVWPNLMTICQRQNRPVFLINARLSARSAKRYQRLGTFSSRLFNQFDRIATQHAVDSARYMALGVEPEKVITIGNIKFDQPIPLDINTKGAYFKKAWSGRLVWIAASTHEGEEEIILAAFDEIRRQVPNILLFLVPRHPQRFARVTNLCRQRGYHVQLRSRDDLWNDRHVDIVIGDTMGELLSFYAASDLAFVGGSLVPTGGHNVLEPAALGLAVLTGTYMFNFNEITQNLEKAGALIKVENSSALAAKVVYLLTHEHERHVMGEQGKALVAENRGAMDGYLKLIAGFNLE